MRITILGLPGSGKSTLARQIADKLHVHYIHIDRLWREGGGGHNSRSTPDPEKTHGHVKAKVLEAIRAESWVSDGVYPLVQPEIIKRADTMIFLDASLCRRLFNHGKRTVASIWRDGEMGFWDNIEFLLEMLSGDLNNTEKIRNLLDAFEGRKVVLKTIRDIDEYFLSLTQSSE